MEAHCLVATQMESSECGELVAIRYIHDYFQTQFFVSILGRNLSDLTLQVSVFRIFFRVLLGVMNHLVFNLMLNMTFEVNNVLSLRYAKIRG